MNSIILMGIKHCGKSTQGKLLAKEFAVPFYDTDDIITEVTSLSPRELYASQGEREFMAAELEACRYLCKKLSEKKEWAVIATGGGICKNTEALSVLHAMGTFVFLQADEEIAAARIIREARVNADGGLENLPAYIAKKNPHSLDEVRTMFHDFYVERSKQYRSVADVCVVMQNAPKAVNLKRISDAVKKFTAS